MFINLYELLLKDNLYNILYLFISVKRYLLYERSRLDEEGLVKIEGE